MTSWLRRAALGVAQLLGMGVGAALAPPLFVFAFARGLRVFHPDGELLVGSFAAAGAEQARAGLDGPVLVRLAPTFVRGLGEAQDVIGLAVRFRGAGDPADPALQPGDQDLLTATFRSFATLDEGKRSTHTHDYLDNEYWAVATFDVPGQGLGSLRWSGVRRESEGGSRAQRLDAAIAANQARLKLQFVRPEGGYHELGELRLERRVSLDQRQLRLSPFHAGRGLRPLGFLNGIRRVAYTASQAGRALRG